MAEFVKWNSQPLDLWAKKHAQGKLINLDGHMTHYKEKGAGEPVILIHGFFYDSYIWAENIDALAEKYKVYSLELWGSGYSTREPLDYSYQLFANQLLLFMDALEIQRASLVGQSIGAGTSILFCVQNRHRVDKLLLVDAAGMPSKLPVARRFLNLPGVGEFLMGLNTNAIRRYNLGDTFIYDKKLITDEYFENVTRFQKIEGTTKAAMSILRRNFFPSLIEDIQFLAQLEGPPILIVWGRQDNAISVIYGEQMHDILKGSRLEIIENAGHVPNYEQSKIFNQLALDFLAG
ncbi:MAG: alpha/beta fold hydrolase [Chloroflexi bacterium]|nr:alpha/beta fold hydrolase [Chloroflexota bacterium]